MNTPDILPAPLLRVHRQRILPYCNGQRLPGAAFVVVVVLNSTVQRMPVAVYLFSLN